MKQTRRLIGLLVAAAVVAMIAFALLRAGPDVPARAVLMVDLSGDFEEIPPTDTLSRLLARGPALATVLLQLEKASVDSRIVGVVLHIRSLQLGLARIQELRDAVLRVREAGTRVVALLDISSLNATREVYLASAADRVFVAPAYLGPLVGIAGEYLFLGGALEKAGVHVEYERIGAYKSAPETLADREMSGPAREMMNGLLDSLFDQIVTGIAEGRDLDPDAVRRLIDEAPATTDEYVSAGLADGVAGRDEILEASGLEGAEPLPVEDYVGVDPRDLGLRNGPVVAVVFGDGAIVQTSQGPRRNRFGADEFGESLKAAAENDEVRAIVLRVNSPGGSPLASDQIWRAIRLAREKKPVVVSMADMAASGGYYVASGADAIVAEPATLTGSIGIFLTRPVLAGLYEKLDIGTEVFARGRLAPLLSSARPLDPAERERLRTIIEVGYAEFVDRVSEGRGLSPEQVDDVGQGRVWLGDGARSRGLVDEIGGLWKAVARAKLEADIPEDVDPRRLVFPAPRTLAQQIEDLRRGQLAAALLEELSPVRLPRIVEAWLTTLDSGPAYLPWHWIVIK